MVPYSSCDAVSSAVTEGTVIDWSSSWVSWIWLTIRVGSQSKTRSPLNGICPLATSWPSVHTTGWFQANCFARWYISPAGVM